MKFTIRDLFLVTVIVALSVGWAVDHWRTANERQNLREENERLAGENSVEKDSYRQLSDVTRAFERALDEARPGWRKPDGHYDIEYSSEGARIPLPPNSSAPAPIRPSREP